jgi:RNA ligase
MKDYILYEKLLKEVEEGRVSASRMGDLTIFKYTQDTHIQGLWNDVNRQARGIIFRDDGTVVARPFPKFFNLGEVSESMVENLPWHEEVEIYEKLDGSCGIGYMLDGRWRLATPGSMESDQAVAGTAILNSQYTLEHLPQGCTPIFEIIYPENRIVVDYKGETFLCLLAIFEHNGEEWHPRRVDQIADKCGFRRPRRYNIDLRGEIPFASNEEGYVARFASGKRVKVKSPAYLRVHRLLNHMSPKGIIELIRGNEYGVTVKELPQGIQQDFDDIRAYVQGMHDKLRIQAESIAARIPEGDRKTQALWIQANTPNELTGIVFGLLDKKSINDKIWKIVLEKVKDEKGKVLASE